MRISGHRRSSTNAWRCETGVVWESKSERRMFRHRGRWNLQWLRFRVRYIVNDVDAAIAFFCQHLGFQEVMHSDARLCVLSRGDLRLDAQRAKCRGRWWPGDARWHRCPRLADGTVSRLKLTISPPTVEGLCKAGAHFRNDIVHWRRWQANPARRPPPGTPSSFSSQRCLRRA